MTDEDIKRRIEESMMMTGGNTPEEKAFWEQGAEFGVSLMQEEVDRLKKKYDDLVQDGAKRGAYTILNQTIESQAKEIDRHISLNGELLQISCKQKDEISQLKEALRYVRSTCYKDKALMKDLDELLTDKELKPMKK